MRTEFFLLGPLAVRTGDTDVTVPRGRLRALLAALLLNANRVVTVDDLAEVQWGEDLPSAARPAVQGYVARLRKALGAAGARITTHPHGYLIRIEPGELDLSRFEDLLRRARAGARAHRWPEAADRAAAALSLWRGEPLADVCSDLIASREGPRLSELRLQALEIRIDADLQLGRHGEVISELRQLAAEQPLRERFHALLMLALYRDGRQAEALAVYQQARQTLVAEVGAEPSTDLQRLHQQILAADPSILQPDTAYFGGKQAALVPHELPGDVTAFTGRAAELAQLDQILLRSSAETRDASVTAAVISAVSGTAGVGKSALALHWAHRAAQKFPDGQLYANLRGFDPSGTPATPEAAIRGFLDALGVAAGRIPADPQAQAGLYRSLLSGQQMLIMLDNASTVEQVRPLLPGHPGCAVVVTSRDSLAGLVARDGAKRLDLDLLPLTDAVTLLRELIGARVDAEPDAAATLARQCARLPLALRVAAELATGRPSVPLASLVAELKGQQQRLDLLQAGGDPATSVRAVFSWSYQQLSGEGARMFRLLGLHSGPDISVPAAASLAAIPESDARRLLGELARANLITEHTRGRYAFHDLLRTYANEQASACNNDDDRYDAIGRLLDYYLHTADRADGLQNPSREPVALAPARPGTVEAQLADQPQAMAWFKEEHQTLLAAVSLAAESGYDSHAWQLPYAMTAFLQLGTHWQEWVTSQRTALAAATRLGDIAAQAISARLLANACTVLGDHDQARRHFAHSLELYQRLGNRLGEAKVQQNLAVLAEQEGCYTEALGHAEQALGLYQGLGHKAAEAVALNSVGWCHGLVGDYQQASAVCRRALALSLETGYRRVEGQAWDSLGYAEHHLGNLAEAAACYQRALTIIRETGDRLGEGLALTHLGDTLHAAGEPARARQAWQQALAILDDLQHPDADQVRAKLASTSDDASQNVSA